MAIRITHRFAAPPQRVFEAWLDPALAGRWLFATATRPMTDVAIEARVGGSFRLARRSRKRDFPVARTSPQSDRRVRERDLPVARPSPRSDRRNGKITEHRGRFIEIVPHRRLVFELIATDRQRAVTRVTVEIAPRKSGCDLALSLEDVPPEQANYSEARWMGMLYGLGEALTSRAERDDSN
jgi:uncharacterized protein YndB with AHSA1/START domain